MIELNRHIEILLISNDCVIVPELGGFMTHHVDARYDDEDHMFVPPVRTLGFNPQLTMNDSLLAQSYIEANDISYPEAMRCIEAEVNELKQQLYNEGYYEMSGIGTLSMNEDGHIVFSPCEAGLLTPSLYGLGAFEMLPLGSAEPVKTVIAERPAQAGTTGTAAEETEEKKDEETATEQDEEQAIVIKMSWIRNAVAVAAAILLFILLTPPVGNSSTGGTPQLTMSQIELLPLPKTIETTKQGTPVATVEAKAQVAAQKQEQEATAEQAKPEEPATVKEEPAAATEEPAYTLVLASQVAQKGAEHLVKLMQQSGYEDTRIHVHRNVRRVVYGHFDSEAAAHNALQKLRSATDKFDEAWVYKTK